MGIWSDWWQHKIDSMEKKGEDIFKGELPVWFTIRNASQGPAMHVDILPAWVAQTLADECVEWSARHRGVHTTIAALRLGTVDEWGVSTVMLTHEYMKSVAISVKLLGEQDRKPENLEHLKRCARDNARLISFLYLSNGVL